MHWVDETCKNHRSVKVADEVCVSKAKNGKIYSGISLIVSVNVGFCSEQAAIVKMIKDRETVINVPRLWISLIIFLTLEEVRM